MEFFKICGIICACDFRHETMIRRSRKYLLEGADELKEEDAQIVLHYNEKELIHLQKDQPHLKINDCEVITTATNFYKKLVKFDCFMLHSSGVVVDDRAYLFSAPSGTGKSTHTGLWMKHFGDKAHILNDDKPAIRFRDGKVYACGTPWSGSSELNVNEEVLLQGIGIVRRSEVNKIEIMKESDVIFNIMDQTIRPESADGNIFLLSMLDKLVKSVKVWKLEVNMEEEAAVMAYEAMSKEE
ncbi:MAG: hypothetical protein K6D02_00060 [Lachnospiraceae bacterium]|nr:hypothetical protein [Lachnospiraceae bacterium]